MGQSLIGTVGTLQSTFEEDYRSITIDGVELGVAITEKAAEKIKYFAEKDGITESIGLPQSLTFRPRLTLRKSTTKLAFRKY